MTDRDADAALDRAADEALALFADDRRTPGDRRESHLRRPQRAADLAETVRWNVADWAAADWGGPAPHEPEADDGSDRPADSPSNGPSRGSSFNDELFNSDPFSSSETSPGDRPTPDDRATRPASSTKATQRTKSARSAKSAESNDPGRPSPPAGVPGEAPEDRPHATPWHAARTAAARAAQPLPSVVRPLGEALGQVLAAPLAALTDLPSFDTSAMDGWAVAGPGPWRLPSEDTAPEGAGPSTGILAGHAEAAPLRDGHAVRIATGARVPPGATAVLRSEHGKVRGEGRELYASRHITQGQDIRPRGQECRRGDELLPAGALVTPVVLGLAAAAGYDELRVTSRPRVEVLVLGDELLRAGLPHDGRIRDALGPMLGPWLRALGAEVTATRHVGDDPEALHAAVSASTADVVITTGGTASGPVDHVHPTLRRLGAEQLVDGVEVRPGHPMLLARIAPGRHLVGLPGNPLAAVSGLLTLAEPLLRTLSARPAPAPYRARLTEAVQGHPVDTRLIPVVYQHGDRARPLRFHGPAMLRGIAAADALAVVPPGGAEKGAEAEILDLPWTADGIGISADSTTGTGGTP
ncbi:molybdopterin molybdotransferase [Streptomyces netropsis]|uniref:Molybdopterin molybdenumtransferase n=1 Tax=Streptomyces netropsis TaxID=55404 RepID=A0A7W7LCH3_STRNE|nr:molybdopterin molybdotransferase MoeA [Streptomyces netropsis]MBB4887670.1 molybdopterin molybdotransferase [Streptomyces netropsis]GGR34158.1 molybdopterin molybdenumtransferase MoeA [Streptomyces netropsis]